MTSHISRRPARRLSAVLALAAIAQACCASEGRTTVSLRQEGEAFVVEASLVVPVPVAVAWDVVTDVDAMARFVPALDESRILARDGGRWRILQRGAMRFGPIAFAWTTEREATLEPRASIRQVQVRGTMRRLDTLTTLAADGDGTSLAYRVDVIPDAPFPDFVTRYLLRRETEAQLDAIRREMLRRNAPPVRVPRESPRR